MGAAIYVLTAVTMAICAVLLGRRFFFKRTRLLLWSAICFALLSLSNILVFVDLVLLPEVDLYMIRLGLRAVGLLFLIYGLVVDSR